MIINPYLLIFLGLIIAFIFYCHCYQFLKVNNQYEIIQMDNPEKDVYEKKMLEKSPTFIMNVISGWTGINEISPDYIQVSPKFLEDTVVKKTLDKYTAFYDIPFCLRKQYIADVGHLNDQTPLVKITDHRILWCQIYGKRRLAIFSPKNKKYLYPNPKNKNQSLINHWALSEQENNIQFPEYSKAKYIEIILSPGQIFYLPLGWWVTTINLDENITVKVKSNSFFSMIL